MTNPTDITRPDAGGSDSAPADLLVDPREFERGRSHESHWLEVAEPAALTWLDERELLAPGTLHARRFVVQVAAVAVLVILAVTAFNYRVDPLGDTRSTGKDQPREVGVKLDQIDAMSSAPGTVVLGSSIVMKYDPADIEDTLGGTAYNAGISSARPSVIYSIASYLEERFDDDMPNLVIGINNFAFTDGAGDDGFLASEPRLQRQIERSAGAFDQLQRLGANASLHRARSSWTKLRGAEDGDPSALGQRGTTRRLFDAQGFLLRRYSTDPAEIERRTTRDINRARATMTRWYEDGANLNGEQVEYLGRTIAIANEHGQRPVVVLVPYNPIATKELAGPAFDAQRAAVLKAVQELQQEHDFDIVDVRDIESIDGSVADFYDASHITSDAARRVIKQIGTQAG